MGDTNFHLAPPVKVVDGLVAVPIDIQQITAELKFDGATESGEGDATFEFTMGAQDGNPIFDLRQTITEAWLDGVPIPVEQLVHHDFGGGGDAELRIVEFGLAANSNHTLRVKYTLGMPQASTAGSYPPAITWSTGPRLTFNFGFTDLGAGRYLEAWVPANLIFDQFELSLEINILNTVVTHTVITNGNITEHNTNHWTINFPKRFTAFSPLLELRASDTVTSLTDTTTLPVSDTVVTVEVWKLVTSSIDLNAQIENIKTWLAENEISTGPYIHGNRFVAFLHTGGMEYEGGTTSGVGPLRHETFHSWWARGLKPASQPDAWWDEAWATYNDYGADISLPLDFNAPPKTLCPRNPWVRITANSSYSSGNRLWEGIAALIDPSNLRTYMSDFYNQNHHKPVTTTNIEEFLVCRSGNPQIVDAFHRFVYGFNDPVQAPDLWIRDDPDHEGSDHWPGDFWNSPDLWIRNADDNGTSHQNPEFGQDNWFYARIRNRSNTATAKHFLVTFNIKQFAGTEFVYPNDFLPCIAAASGFELGPNESTIVKAKWPVALVPPPGNHACWLAAVFTRFDHPISDRHVWEHNNLAQKNLTVVDLAAGDWFILPFVMSNFRSRRRKSFILELRRPVKQYKLKASIIHSSDSVFRLASKYTSKAFSIKTTSSTPNKSSILDCSGQIENISCKRANGFGQIITSSKINNFVKYFPKGIEMFFPYGCKSKIPVLLRSQEQRIFGLRLHVPKNTKPGETIQIDLVQRERRGKAILGGLAIMIRVH